MYFVNSMSDLFHEDVPFTFIDRVFAIMKACPQHTFQILTKRPWNMIEYFRGNTPQAIDDATQQLMEDGAPIGDSVCLVQMNGTEGWPLPNVWIGVSVENQKAADERIQYLNSIPAAVKFLSCEPLLGPVDFEKAIGDSLKWHVGGLKNCISWVIVGGESGHNARPMHPDWVRTIRDQCMEAGVPFFMKQWGEWAPIDFHSHKAKHDMGQFLRGRWNHGEIDNPEHYGYTKEHAHQIMQKIGKKEAGRLLDGQLHDEFPM